MWYTKGALISLSHGFVKYQSLYDLLGSFILPYSIQFVYNVFIIVVIYHNDRLSQISNLRQPLIGINAVSDRLVNDQLGGERRGKRDADAAVQELRARHTHRRTAVVQGDVVSE